MHEETKPGMRCPEFDALLSDALDGTLGSADRQRFEAHRASCPNCGPMFEEARTGMTLLHSLAEVEPPANFVHNVLAGTTGRVASLAPAAGPRESWWTRLRTGVRPVLGPVLQPKFAMSFAMAFFSLSLVLNLAGFKLGNLRHLDLSPNAIVKGAYEAQGRVVKYYENIRFVYELESRVQELKRVATPEESARPAEKPKDRSKDHSGNPEQNKYRNYSREQESITVARLFESAPLPSSRRETAVCLEPRPSDQVFARRNA